MDYKKQLQIIKQGIDEIIGEDDLVQKLKDNKILTIKIGRAHVWTPVTL